MNIAAELRQLVVIIIACVFLVALLWQAPWYLTTLMIVPLAMAFYFWPEGSTVLAYLVGALVGTLLTYASVLGSVDGPIELAAYIWLPLVWGPAGIIIKRAEVVALEIHQRRKRRA